MKLAFVSGLSEKKLTQKLLPLQALEEVEEIHLYRRHPYTGKKILWIPIPRCTRNWPVVGDLLRFFQLSLRCGHYDAIIGCHQSFHGMIAHLCGKAWKKPVIQIIIADVDWVVKRPFLKSVLLAADACAVRGPISSERLRGWGYPGRIDILPNPYTLPLPTPDIAMSNRRYDFVAVGDFAVEKAYPWMMSVLAEVKERWPGLKVAIVGKGPYLRNLSSFLSKNGLNQHVEFLGWKDGKALEETYRNSKAFLLTSSSEGLPMALLEAMSHRLPVFVTGVGDIPWLVRDGEEGRVIPYGETRRMSKAMLAALDNPALLENMGKKAYARMASLSREFSPKAIVETWSGLLRFVLQEGRTDA